MITFGKLWMVKEMVTWLVVYKMIVIDLSKQQALDAD